eukprot:gene15147-1539_t
MADPVMTDTEWVTTGCFTAMRFSVPAAQWRTVHGKPLNYTADTTNDMIWGAHSDKWLSVSQAGKHSDRPDGTRVRGRVNINLHAGVGPARRVILTPQAAEAGLAGLRVAVGDRMHISTATVAAKARAMMAVRVMVPAPIADVTAAGEAGFGAALQRVVANTLRVQDAQVGRVTVVGAGAATEAHFYICDAACPSSANPTASESLAAAPTPLGPLAVAAAAAAAAAESPRSSHHGACRSAAEAGSNAGH